MTSPFSLTPEQSDIQRSIRRLFTELVTSEYLHRRITDPSSGDPELRSRCDELGLFEYFSSDDPTALPVVGDLVVVAEEAGRALLPEPLAEQLLCGPFLLNRLLQASDRDSCKDRFGADRLSELLDGRARVSLAPLSNLSEGRVKVGKGAAPAVNGSLHLVPAVSEPGWVLLVNGDSLVLIPLPQKGAVMKPHSALDLTIARQDVDLKSVSGIRYSARRFGDALSIVTAAELSGVSTKAVEMTVEYVKTRKQFGRPVGSFQAVQHRLADMYRESASLQALTRFAAWAFTHSPDQSRLAAETALHYAVNHAPAIVEGAIQLHGGIGFTWEFDLHLYLRRAKSLQALFRDDEQAERILRAAS